MDGRILFTGDLYFDYDEIPSDIEAIGDWIRRNDLKTIVNLEGPITDPDPRYSIEKRGPNLSSSDSISTVLDKLNVVGASLANNHMMDYGEYGIKNTITSLDKCNIHHSGAGADLNEALVPFVIDFDGIKVSVLSFGWDVEETRYAADTGYGCAPRDKEIIIKAVQDARELYDRIVVCMHWGFEFNRYPMPYDIDLAHAMIDAGADIIIGNHPHCVQPYEEYHNKMIFYSLGNFYFGGKRTIFKKSFHEKIENQPDYGIMVIYDPLTGETETQQVIYSAEKNESVIDNTSKQDVLYELPALDEKQYLKLAYRSRNNSNPILTADEAKNKRMIRRLYFIYDLKKTVRHILGRA